MNVETVVRESQVKKHINVKECKFVNTILNRLHPEHNKQQNIPQYSRCNYMFINVIKDTLCKYLHIGTNNTYQ